MMIKGELLKPRTVLSAVHMLAGIAILAVAWNAKSNDSGDFETLIYFFVGGLFFLIGGAWLLLSENKGHLASLMFGLAASISIFAGLLGYA